MRRWMFALSVGLLLLGAKIAQGEKNPSRKAFLAKARAILGSPYKLPEGVEASDVASFALFNFTSTHVADVRLSAKGAPIQISFYPKYRLERRETTETEQLQELTAADYQRAVEKADALQPLGALVSEEKGCVVTGGNTLCRVIFTHAHVHKVLRSRLVNASTGEFQESLRLIEIVYQRTIVGRVRAKEFTPKNPEPFPPSYAISLSSDSYAVGREFYERVRIGDVVRLSVFGCETEASECLVEDPEVLPALPLTEAQSAMAKRAATIFGPACTPNEDDSGTERTICLRLPPYHEAEITMDEDGKVLAVQIFPNTGTQLNLSVDKNAEMRPSQLRTALAKLLQLAPLGRLIKKNGYWFSSFGSDINFSRYQNGQLLMYSVEGRKTLYGLVADYRQ